jgi:CRISPR-associated endonuclease/helicase Cas3
VVTFDEFFQQATGRGPAASPFPYQRRLACEGPWPSLIEVPTGLGKTLAVLLGWLWRRRPDHPERARTPRRLVYCLPMRVLVEQTRDVARDVIARLQLSTRVVVLMGGVDDDGEWDIHPEEDVLLLGTQDMLVSRALNRGYGMSRFRWPLHFGLLNNDALWVVDEVQLTGASLTTSAQLQALRRKLGTIGPTQTSWMSATLDEQWLRTVDVADVDLRGRLTLNEADRADAVVQRRLRARKAVSRATAAMGDLAGLAAEVLAAHQPATRTIAIVNTVERARDLYAQLRRRKPAATLVLLHSRFRPADRAAAVARALAPPEAEGTIVVSTQVIEAGVDLTSKTLFTEVAPWASLVQRLGRCNRAGDDGEARVFWVGLPVDDKARAKSAPPYPPDELAASEDVLTTLVDGGPASLPRLPMATATGLVLRRRDVLDLFDTTTDLAGNDVDVSRFVRETDDQDCRVFWRAFDDEPADDQPSPGHDELCATPLAVVRKWLSENKRLWTWDALRGRFVVVERVFPGLTVLRRSADGGYDPVLGLDPQGSAAVAPIARPPAVDEDRTYDGDPESEWRRWYTLREHSDDVAQTAAAIATALDLPPRFRDELVTAARWHDAGKAHTVWQEAARALGVGPPDEPVAKSQAQKGHIRYARRGFRHELASALLGLRHGLSDLACFLVACHHGKVRVSLRSLPTEDVPVGADGQRDASIRHARGVWEGDTLPAVDLGAGVVVSSTTLTLAYMELGDDEQTGASWATRVLALRDAADVGPFRLAYLEGLIKCADERASRAAGAGDSR